MNHSLLYQQAVGLVAKKHPELTQQAVENQCQAEIATMIQMLEAQRQQSAQSNDNQRGRSR